MDSNSINNTDAVLPEALNFTDGWTQLFPYTGNKFETKITFPTIYPRRGEVYDITSKHHNPSCQV